MKIIVFGAGAIGGYFGGKLAEKGFDVTFLVRQNRYEQLKKNGLNVKSVHGDCSVNPKLVVDVNDIEKPELVILAVKNYHIQEALPQLRTLVEKGAKILPLLNGIGHLELLITELGEENVVGGLCSIESTLNENGDVIQTSALQDLVFGPLRADYSNDPLLLKFKEMLESANINVSLSDYIIGEMWKKYIFITALSGITTTLRQPIGVSLKDHITFAFLEDLIMEMYQIAVARGVNLPEETPNSIIKKLQSLSPMMTASMHRDLEKGFPLELDDLHGYGLKLAEEYQLQTPCLRSVYVLLHPYKNGEIKQ